MRDDELHAHLRDTARSLEQRSRAASPDDAIERPAPHLSSRWRTPALAAAAALAVVGGVAVWLGTDDDAERVDVVTPAPDDTSTTTPPPTTDGTTTTEPAPPPVDLPNRGFVVRDPDDAVAALYGMDGHRIGEVDSPVLIQLGTGSGPTTLSVFGDLANLGLLPPDPAEATPGCTQPAGGAGVRVVLCGSDLQQPTVIGRAEPWGEVATLTEALHTDPSGEPIGHWRWALPSPDGQWILGQWSGECEVPSAVLVPSVGGAPTPVEGAAAETPVESIGLGWTTDSEAIVQFGSGVCGSGVDVPGVYLVDPATLEQTLVRRVPPRASVWLWEQDPGTANPLERTFARAAEELGVEGCCGEPSHGSEALTAGVVWQGTDIPIGAAPSTDPPYVPFNDLVISSEPVDIAGLLPATAGEADLGPFVAFTCGDATWTLGGAGLGDRATREQVESLAEVLIPHLYCTVGERPLATGHGDPGPEASDSG